MTLNEFNLNLIMLGFNFTLGGGSLAPYSIYFREKSKIIKAIRIQKDEEFWRYRVVLKKDAKCIKGMPLKWIRANDLSEIIEAFKHVLNYQGKNIPCGGALRELLNRSYKHVSSKN